MSYNNRTRSPFKGEYRDKFGRNRDLVGLKDKNRSGFPKGYTEINGTLFQLTLSPSKKEGVEHWVTITEMPKNR